MRDTIDFLHQLADRWSFCLLLAAVGVAAIAGPWRRRTAPLALPACGFLVRKALLFIPLCGAASTADDIVFWSGGAYAYYLILFGIMILAAWGIRSWLVQTAWWNPTHPAPTDTNPDAVPSAIFTGGFLVLLAAGVSAMMLPVDGNTHLYTPALCVLGLPKLLLTSPVLLWACWTGVFVQLLAVALPRPAMRNAGTVVLLAAVLMGGAVSLLGQPFAILSWNGPSPEVRAIRAAPLRPIPFAEEKKNEQGQKARRWWEPEQKTKENEEFVAWWSRNVGETEPEAEAYFAQWCRLLPEIDRTGVNLVEKEIPAQGWNTPSTRTEPTDASPWGIFMSGILGLVVASAWSEWKRWPRTAPRGDPPGTHTPPPKAGDRTLMLDALRARIRARANGGPALAVLWCLGLAVGPPLFLLLVALVGRLGSTGASAGALLVGLGGVPLVLALLVVAFSPLRAAAVLPEQEHALAAFVTGDRQGRTNLAPWLLTLLAELGAEAEFHDRLLAGQQPAVLVDCLLCPHLALRQEALRRLPADTPSPQVNRLSAANFPECRVAAVKQRSCPRRTRLRLTNDPDRTVRQAAMGLLVPLSRAELGQLIVSSHADVRAVVLAQPEVAREQLIGSAGEDSDATVRKVAQKRLNDLPTEEIERLVRSQWPDARIHALAQNLTPRRQLVQSGNTDTDVGVRKAALGRLSALTPEELDQLVGSSWVDAREFAVEQPRITRAQLVHLASKDEYPQIRARARNHLAKPNAEELKLLVRSPWADTRGFAASQTALSRDHLLQLASRDPDDGVRKTAQNGLKNPSAGELEMFVTSPHAGARQYAVGQPDLTRDRVRTLCADASADVARAAFGRFGLDATADELGGLAVNAAIWQELVSHPLTPHVRVAALLSEHIPRSQYVVDVPAEYSEYQDSYGSTSSSLTRAEEGHQEYNSADGAVAVRLIDAVPGRRTAVLQHLQQINAALYAFVC